MTGTLITLGALLVYVLISIAIAPLVGGIVMHRDRQVPQLVDVDQVLDTVLRDAEDPTRYLTDQDRAWFAEHGVDMAALRADDELVEDLRAGRAREGDDLDRLLTHWRNESQP